MTNYDVSTYGERVSEYYDTWYADCQPGMVETLTELASGGRVLELGIGTGRVALPLREKGVEIHGIDASPQMVAKLRAKPGGQGIPVAIGDFADPDVKGPFSLVFVVFNTFFALLTQSAQKRCLKNVAGLLAPDGKFLMEAFVPDLGRFDRGQSIRTSQISDDAVRLECSRHDPVLQRVDTQLVLITPQGMELLPIQVRYAWPSELDLMAELASLKLAERWGGWNREPFTANSRMHVSVYERV